VYFSFDRRIDTTLLGQFYDKPFNLKARRNDKGKQKAGYLKINKRSKRKI